MNLFLAFILLNVKMYNKLRCVNSAAFWLKFKVISVLSNFIAIHEVTQWVAISHVPPPSVIGPQVCTGRGLIVNGCKDI